MTDNHLTVTIYGKALPMFGSTSREQTITLIRILSKNNIDIQRMDSITDDTGTFTASFHSRTPMNEIADRALTALERETESIAPSNGTPTWRMDIFVEDEADISYNLEDLQDSQLEDDWNWGLPLDMKQ